MKGRTGFLLVSAVQRGIPFALLPLFVSVLTPTQYGHVGVVTAAFSLGSMTFGLGQDLVAYRYFFSEDPLDRGTFSAAVLGSTCAPLALAVLVAGGVLIGRPDIGGTPPEAIALSTLGAALFVVSWQIPAVTLRCTERTIQFFAFSLLYTAAVAIAKVVLVVGFDAGAIGWSLADVIGSLVLLAGTTPMLFKLSREAWSNRAPGNARVAVGLGGSVAVSQVARWASGFSDRMWVVALLSPITAGSYLIAAQLVTIGNIFVIELARFLQPRIGRRDHRLGELLRVILPRHAAYTALIVVGVIAVTQAFVAMGLAADYDDVGAIAAALAVMLAFMSFNYVGGDIHAVYLGNTSWLAGVSIVVGTLSLGSNYVLISDFGVWGAVATALGGQIMTFGLLWVPIISRRLDAAVTAPAPA